MNEAAGRFRLALFGEERPHDMLVLLGSLVLVGHLWLAQWLMQSDEVTTQAKPLVMDVSMVHISVPKPTIAPPQPAPPVEKKPLPKRSLPKPIERKPPPVVQKTEDFAPVDRVIEQPQPVSQPAATTSAPPSTSAASSEQFVEANYRANYLHNPKPAYPAIARSRGWTGKVMLKVRVSAEGTAEKVEVEQSSGHDILDENAIEAVKQWRFTPAKRGETPVASTVIVPLDYKLNNN